MSDKREFVRTPFTCRILIRHESIGELVVKTRDISDGGVFVILDPDQIPPVGSVVTGQVQGMPGEAPVVKMEVVRAEPDGVGLKFINEPEKSS